jgi:hypothetical protein
MYEDIARRQLLASPSSDMAAVCILTWDFAAFGIVRNKYFFFISSILWYFVRAVQTKTLAKHH